MKIIFLGTKGFIKHQSRWHKRHTSTMIVYRKKKLVIDFGRDWQGLMDTVQPDALLLTHGHPDHVEGLKCGAPCPVYATRDTWRIINNYPLQDRHLLKAYQPITICGMTVETFPVVHSLRAPAVGFKITAGKKTIFCVHDLISIKRRHKALAGVDLYIGDGATITRPLVRRTDDKIFGHTTIRAQLGWCAKEGVRKAIITHCGSVIVAAKKSRVEQKIYQLAAERGVQVQIAYDGLEIRV